MRMASSTVENYLKAIWRLQARGGGAVLVGRIARELRVTPGTVTAMMNHLRGEGLVDYVPRRGVRLRKRGEKAALQVLRRHRLIELFLTEIMKLDWAQVHEEAEVLEHVISDRLLERMDEMLGYPTRDPHGDPIPDVHGSLPDQKTVPLAECGRGIYHLVRITDDEASFLDWLHRRELLPGARIEVVETDEHAGILTLRLDSGEAVLRIGTQAAKRLLVKS